MSNEIKDFGLIDELLIIKSKEEYNLYSLEDLNKIENILYDEYIKVKLIRKYKELN